MIITGQQSPPSPPRMSETYGCGEQEALCCFWIFLVSQKLLSAPLDPPEPEFKMSRRQIKTPLVCFGLGDRNTFFFSLVLVLTSHFERWSVPCDESVTLEGICVLFPDKRPSKWSKQRNRCSAIYATSLISLKSHVNQQLGVRSCIVSGT